MLFTVVSSQDKPVGKGAGLHTCGALANQRTQDEVAITSQHTVEESASMLACHHSHTAIHQIIHHLSVSSYWKSRNLRISISATLYYFILSEKQMLHFLLHEIYLAALVTSYFAD